MGLGLWERGCIWASLPSVQWRRRSLAPGCLRCSWLPRASLGPIHGLAVQAEGMKQEFTGCLLGGEHFPVSLTQEGG